MGSIPGPSCIVVGAGCFGASAALYLSKARPSAKIILIDRTPFPNPSAAAHDLNKIIRADYADPFYMRLVLEAQELWRHDPLYKPYYHESGMLFVEDTGMGEDIVCNYKQLLGTDGPGTIVDSDTAKYDMFDGVFKNANWDGIEKTYWNPKSGWGEAHQTLRAVIQASIDNGVEYVATGVESVMFDDSGRSYGVKLIDGTVLTANQILLCTGAHTPSLLADSAPHTKSIQVGDRLVAAGAVTCCVRIPEDRRARFKNAPVVFNGLKHTCGECVPLTADGYLKFNYEISFTHNVAHDASGQSFSQVPLRVSQSTWGNDVPEGLKKEVRAVMKHIYGSELNDIPVESYRMCWDAVTPNQDWIISRHPHSQGLYVATGGSFHAWKFLPTIGKYIVQMLDDKLSEDMVGRWAWDRSDEGGACKMYVPTRDLLDIEGYQK